MFRILPSGHKIKMMISILTGLWQFGKISQDLDDGEVVYSVKFCCLENETFCELFLLGFNTMDR